ncbi:MAG: iron-containing redox enzyme family protein [Alphaproteobacteria bacterium]|nr:iron-containing redox enzyme family protein [Alphaproteobacteria bacterium]
MDYTKSQDVLRALLQIWADFSSRLDALPLIDKLNRGKFRIEDYKILLMNHRQQVVEGGRWIARAASSIDDRYFELRSKFMTHCVTEHRDFRMLEQNYVSLGGTMEEIQKGEKNIGTEALNAFMFHRASQPNPFDLLGAMFIIEGLGQNKAGEWGGMIRDQLGLKDEQVSFLLYHADHDDGHMDEFEEALKSGILEIPGMGQAIVKTAKIVARLYLLQIDEIDNF